jgi:hypothetical protein
VRSRVWLVASARACVLVLAFWEVEVWKTPTCNHGFGVLLLALSCLDGETQVRDDEDVAEGADDDGAAATAIAASLREVAPSVSGLTFTPVDFEKVCLWDG